MRAILTERLQQQIDAACKWGRADLVELFRQAAARLLGSN